MISLLRALLPVLFLLLFCSCKKNDGESAAFKTSLPNFGNVDPEEIFSREDGKLKNRDSVIALLDNYYQTIWEKGNLWGGFLVAKGDDILYENYRGFAQDKEAEPITDTVALHVASVSKTLTSAAVLKLAEAKKLDLQDPVIKFFPGFPYPKVTLFTLLSQRSGLPKYEHFIEKIQPAPAELSKKFLTNLDVLNLLISHKPPLEREPNTGFMYCNTNFALLALVVEKVTGVPFPEAMQQMVFRPLKMKNTYIWQEKDTAWSAKSFFQRGPRLYPYDRLDGIYGDKNVYSTPRDLLNFSKALYAKKFLAPELQKLIFEPYSLEKPGVNNYGLGFRMKIFDNGNKLTYHNGWWHGSNAVFAHLLQSNVTIIALGNKYSQRVYSALALSGLFEDFPQELARFQKDMELANPTAAPQLIPETYSE